MSASRWENTSVLSQASRRLMAFWRSSRALNPLISVSPAISRSGGVPLKPTMSAKNIVFCAMPAVKNRSAEAS